MSMLKPPTTDALDRAIQILLESIATENQSPSSHTTNAADSPGEIGLSSLTNKYESLITLEWALSQEVNCRKRKLGRLINPRRCINSLPTELLIDVLLTSMKDNNYGGVRRQFELSHVQSSWWSCISSSPHFWTVLSVENLPCVPFKIHKSGSFPLTVEFSRYQPLGDIDSFLGLTTAEKHRWASVHYQGSRPEHILRHLTAPLPMLHDLDLTKLGFQPPPMDLIPLDAPNLRRLSTHGLQLPILRPSHLTTLEIMSIGGDRLRLPYLQSMLDNPSLKVLRLEKLSLNDIGQLGMVPRTFRDLEELSLCELPRQLTLQLLVCVDSPKLSRLKIKIHPFGDDAARLLSDLLLSPSSSPMLTPLQHGSLYRLEVIISTYKLQLRGHFKHYPDRYLVTLSGKRPWRSILEGMTARLPFHALNIPVELHLDEPLESEPHPPTFSFINQLPTITVLVLNCALDIASLVITHLGKPPDGPEGAGSWPCPVLKSVALDHVLGRGWTAPDWEEFLERLANMKENRATAGIDEAGNRVPQIKFYRSKQQDNRCSFSPVDDIRNLPQPR